MTQKYRTKSTVNLSALWCVLLALQLIVLPPAQAQNTRPVPALQEPQLNQIAAPIALYPDALLAQLLMASTYPLDVAEAARWSARYPAPTQLAIGKQRWEPSVKALLAFAPILAMMNKEKKWTAQLSSAIIKQPAVLLDTVQVLRGRAYDNGALHTARQLQVHRQNNVITLVSAENRRIYVPYYDPSKIFGAAGNSLLPAEYWAAQAYSAPSGKTDGIVFSNAVEIPDRRFYDAGIDWRDGQLTLRSTSAGIGRNTISTGPGVWQHDPRYRARKRSDTTSVTTGTIGTETPPPAGAIGNGGTVSTRDNDAATAVPGRISTLRHRTGGQ